MSRIRLLVALSLVVVFVGTGSANAWNADFFEDSASGTSTYEEMAIQPQAVYDAATERTFLVYQGYQMNPYAIAYDHHTDEWSDPVQIGVNPLRDDHHGGPAVVIDAEGHLVVFYGSHLSPLLHARSKRPGDIGAWIDLGPVRVGSAEETITATYPQAFLDADGAINLYYRRDRPSPTQGDLESIVSTPAASGSFGWTAPVMVLDASNYNSAEPTTTGSYWYANFDYDSERGPAVAAVRRDVKESPSDFYIRKGVYYIEQSAEPTWTSAAGASVGIAGDYTSLAATAAVRPEGDGVFTNQVVMRRDADGSPGVLYLAGTHFDGVYEWRFARWLGSEWRDRAIAVTDNFFDAGTFEFMPDGSIEAFLTTGGSPDDQWFDDPLTALDEGLAATRGGDISWWRSADGESWDKVGDVITSPGPHARYNNPQIVPGHDSTARLMFSEWNNDGSNFIHKVFLWGDDGFKQRTFTPEFTRLAGEDRISTAAAVSRTGFPTGATVAVVAASHDFPDALCGVPLAHTLRSPVLLSHRDVLVPELQAELLRLNVSTVIILGGEQAVSTAVEQSIRHLVNSRGRYVQVERIAGATRYETSAKVARRMIAARGTTPEGVVLASGETFADALAVSPYAARRGYPVLLTPSTRADVQTADVLAELAPERVVVVGGEAAVAADVVDSYTGAYLPDVDRWGGDDRYATARIIAEHALESGHSLERFALATGENFADALGGGLLMARFNGVVLTTPSLQLHPEVTTLVERYAFAPGVGVLDVFVLGGPVAISPDVADDLADQVQYLDKQAME